MWISGLHRISAAISETALWHRPQSNMRGDDRVRLRHMLDSAREASGFVARRSREDLDENRMLALALVRCIEIVGEAGSQVSQEGRAEAPNLPWKEIVAMRNRLTHAYFDINLDIVWQTAKSDHPL